MSPHWLNAALVAAGGALGSVARWGVNHWVGQRFGAGSAWPWATFGVNMTGSFAIGVVAGLALNGSLGISPAVRLFLAVGILGGFTTFSSFSLELVTASEAGHAAAALAYAVTSVAAGGTLAFAGAALGRMVR